MFYKPSKIITIDTLIGIKGTSRRPPVHTKSIPKKEVLVTTATPTLNNVNHPVLEKCSPVELGSCYKEPHVDGSTIIWVGDRL